MMDPTEESIAKFSHGFSHKTTAKDAGSGKSYKYAVLYAIKNAPAGTWTQNLRIRSPLLCPVELQARGQLL